MSEVYFYGCDGSPGHWFRDRRGASPRWLDTDEFRNYAYETAGDPGRKNIRWGDWDPNAQPLGEWRLRYHEASDLTFYGCWDRSGDARYGSVSIFIARGRHDEQAMTELARAAFPALWGRIKAGAAR